MLLFSVTKNKWTSKFLFSIYKWLYCSYICEFRRSLLKKSKKSLFIRENVLNSLVFSDITIYHYTVFSFFYFRPKLVAYRIHSRIKISFLHKYQTKWSVSIKFMFYYPNSVWRHANRADFKVASCPIKLKISPF